VSYYRTNGPWLSLQVLGEPVGQGNLRHLGKGRPAIHQNKERLLPWREQVQHAAEQEIADTIHAGRFPIDGEPVAIDVTFTVRKPVSAPKRRQTWPITRPDTDHLLRAIGDALTAAGVWRDDSQLVEIGARKVYPGEHTQALHVPGVVVYVYTVRPVADIETKEAS
jgi:Holliday junction resolvase RusA-like endonuclease